MSKRDFVMLAKAYSEDKHNVFKWLMSEKLDGLRAIWDGGISAGKSLLEVPYSNKSMIHRFAQTPICTGLWSRYGNVIHAPKDWVATLPKGIFLDGELYMGPGKFQETSSITRSFEADWTKVEYRVFDSPPPELILESGVIRSNGGGAFTVPPAALPWALERGVKRLFAIGAPFLERLSVLKGLVKVHEQTIVDNNVDAFMEQVLLSGGEGVIFKSNSPYVCKRSDRMLKYKPFSDDEGTVSGYTTGRETERGSKLLGMMGSLEVLWKGKVFEISGFTEAERSLRTVGDKDGVKALSWAMENPESKVPDWIEASEFPRGSRVTFTYRELSDDGIPKEARYLRKRDSE